MAGVFLDELDEILAVLTEAVRTRDTVRVFMREPEGSGRPARIVEGMVIEVADGRDGRTRVRFAIPTGAGEPVEVRVLVEGIERAELVAAGSGPVHTTSGAMLRPSAPNSILERTQTPGVVPAGAGRWSLAPSSPDQTGPRKRNTRG